MKNCRILYVYFYFYALLYFILKNQFFFVSMMQLALSFQYVFQIFLDETAL